MNSPRGFGVRRSVNRGAREYSQVGRSDGSLLVQKTAVIAPNTFLTVVSGILHLTRRGLAGGSNLPIDVLFESLAQTYRERAVAIVLFGMGSDGTRGMRSSKANGGLTLAQEPISAPHDVISDPPFTRPDLLSGRNLMIYFTAPLQRRLVPLFHYSRRPCSSTIAATLFTSMAAPAAIWSGQRAAPTGTFTSWRETAAAKRSLALCRRRQSAAAALATPSRPKRSRKIFSLRETDVGRPISDLSSSLEYPSMLSDIQDLLRTLMPSQKEVPTTDGRWFSVWIMPYRMVYKLIPGATLPGCGASCWLLGRPVPRRERIRAIVAGTN